MSDRTPVAILGAGGMIGQQFARLLADHPWFEVVALTGGERSRGVRLGERWQIEGDPPDALARRRIEPTSPGALARAGVRLAFSALPSGRAGGVETELARRGIRVFSNASDHRRDPGVPLLVPEVNADHLRLGPGGRPPPIVTNPNCTAAGLVVALAPIWRLLAPRVVHVATYQALSGAGWPGVPALAATDNVVPYIPEEEAKIDAESRRILGRRRGRRIVPRRVRFLAQCVRVPVRDGHLEAVTITAGRRPEGAEILEALRRFDPLAAAGLPTAPHPPILVRPEADRPQPIRDRWAGGPGRARGMAVSVGRIRWEPPYLRLLVLSHNTVRGGAGGSVLNAELAARPEGIALPREG